MISTAEAASSVGLCSEPLLNCVSEQVATVNPTLLLDGYNRFYLYALGAVKLI